MEKRKRKRRKEEDIERGTETKASTDDPREEGISARMRSWERAALPDSTPQPAKNCLKQREPNL